MNIQFRDESSNKAINAAASLAKMQLEYAEKIVDLARPGNGNDSVLIAAVLQAIATNYAVVQGPQR